MSYTAVPGLLMPGSFIPGTIDTTNAEVDPLGLTDSLTIAQTEAQSLTETEGLTDALTVAQTERITPTDPEGLTDSATTAMTQRNTFTETAGLTDSLTLAQTQPVSFADSEGLTDNLVFGLSFVQADSEGLTDVLGLTSTEVESKADTTGLTDALTLVQTQRNTFADNEGLTDILSLDGNLNLADPMGLTDAVGFVQTHRLTFTETEGLTTNTPVAPVGAGPGVDIARSLVLGPGSIYLADFGAVEPTTPGTPDPLVWSDLGGLLGGVDLDIAQEYKITEFKQMPDVISRRVTKRTLKVKTELAEATLQALVYALNEDPATRTTGTGYVAFAPTITASRASALTYRAILIRGWAPGYTGSQQKRRTLILRKGISMDNVSISYTKSGQATYTVTWTCHYVSSSIAPFFVVDEA